MPLWNLSVDSSRCSSCRQISRRLEWEAGHPGRGRRRMKTANLKIDRRSFLKASAASTGGLLLGFYLPERNKLAAQTAASDAKLNAFVHVGSDDNITLFLHKSEMGQGVVTSLSQLLGEELECDWKKIRTEFAGVDMAYGPLQGTFGSMSIRTTWDSLRKAGASAREMLVAAAAQKW